MSDVGSNSFAVNRRSRHITDYDPRRPVRMKCAKCGQRVLNVIPVKTLWALPPAMVAKNKKDREINVEHWCLACVRSADVEDDRSQTNVSVLV